MNHQFDVGHAVRFGIHEAIIMANLAFWIKKNKANKKSFKDGRYWTYNSAAAFAELFPYLSVHQVRRALDKLEAEGVILKANHNQSAYDRTTWFAFTDEWNDEICEDHFANLPNGSRKVAKSLIDTDRKPDKPRASLADDGGEHFKTFWSAYPKKAGKDAAKKAFAKRKFDEQAFEKVMAALNEQKASEQWQKDGGQFIPHPATWLNQGRFEDELPNGSHQINASAFSGAI
ncbi:hypothetical protein [Chryseobacterium sp.]|uniref:hypothetical protein n=1 Tax=Chryseobacterium sp. TaxID=1871047 RepID=UPI0032190A8A